MSALAKFNGLAAIASLLYPPVCTICAATIAQGEYLCGECDTKTTRIVPPFCAKCSEPFEGAITNEFNCADCEHRSLQFDAAVAAYRSRGIVRRVILDFKYGRQLHLRHLVARWLLRPSMMIDFAAASLISSFQSRSTRPGNANAVSIRRRCSRICWVRSGRSKTDLCSSAFVARPSRPHSIAPNA